MKEIWKNIEGYEELYRISNLGEVKILKRKVKSRFGYRMIKEKIKKPFMDKGYLRIELIKNKKGKKYFIHRLVAQAFISNPKNKKEINHIDGIKNNNKVNNLEWCTRSENALHSYKLKLQLPVNGEKNGRSKLKECQVKKIRELNKKGLTIYKLSKITKMNYFTIWGIINKKYWKHII